MSRPTPMAGITRTRGIAIPVCPLPFSGPTASRREVPGQHGPTVVLLVRQCQGKLGWGCVLWGCPVGMCPALNQVKPQQDAWLQDSLGLGPEALLMVEMWLCPAGTPCVGTVPWCHSSRALPWHLSVLGNESKTPVTQGSHSPPLIFQWGLGFACPPPPLPSSCWLSWDLGI